LFIKIFTIPWDVRRELPIVQFPSYVEEMSTEFTHFEQLMTGFVSAEKKTMAHMNGMHS